jgi:hypothetical protein
MRWLLLLSVGVENLWFGLFHRAFPRFAAVDHRVASKPVPVRGGVRGCCHRDRCNYLVLVLLGFQGCRGFLRDPVLRRCGRRHVYQAVWDGDMSPNNFGLLLLLTAVKIFLLPALYRTLDVRRLSFPVVSGPRVRAELLARSMIDKWHERTERSLARRKEARPTHDSSRAFDVCGMNGHGPFVPLDPSVDRISDLPVLHRKSLRVKDQRPPSGAACIIPFAFACTYEGAELHPRVLAIRLPFRVERDAIPDLLSRSPCSNNIRRNARSPCTCHSSALS